MHAFFRLLPLALLAFFAPAASGAPALPPHLASPDEEYGELFTDVQRARVFPDQKTFVDCVPRGDPARILAQYREAKARGGTIDLRQFVAAHFLLPETAAQPVPAARSLEEHLNSLWAVLRRAPDERVPGSSLLPLPHPYVVPGGRFREVYYWDSYFTMLGLRESGREDLIEAMVRNFAFLIETYGLIPNGNRTYYLSRSQPPFFALMVELLAEQHGAGVYREYLPALRDEYAYWMDERGPTQHLVEVRPGRSLNRYYDRQDTPRPEAFALDEDVARAGSREPAIVFRELRSAAESGWDFSSRWLADGRRLATIETTERVPIDLNALLFQLERTLARAYETTGDAGHAQALRAAAQRRKETLLGLCWSDSEAFFFDYDLGPKRRSTALTLAGVVPLFVGIATPEQARAAAETLRKRFLRPGGVVTTTVATGQQWDAPNGWAPLQWMTIRGLENYEEHALAEEIARRWIKLNRDVYARTGRMMEKYDVENTERPAGGGEYPSQDGFGWTNGVLLKLLSMYR